MKVASKIGAVFTAGQQKFFAVLLEGQSKFGVAYVLSDKRRAIEHRKG